MGTYSRIPSMRTVFVVSSISFLVCIVMKKIPAIRNLLKLDQPEEKPNPYPNRNLHIPSGIGMSGTGL